MCGITGFVGFSDKKLIKKMTDSIKHRGPDGYGYYINDSVCLGHRRLSIIDISTGDQPMYNEDGNVVVVFNGEIYNYKELREDLLKKKHKFNSDSDTEVLVHLWEEYGSKMVGMLRGMFAFAIWDDSKKVLFAARDHIGIKPFYYCVDGGGLLFASEIKAILKWKGYDKVVDRKSLNDYLAFGYVPGEKTMFLGVKKLLPGHYMMFRDGKIDVKSYWKPEFSEFVTDENIAVSKLDKLFDESVKVRLMSDVPFGAFLSGGVDSSLIVALMSKHMDEPVKTFSVGFGESDDELPYARIVADKFGTDHTEKVVEADDLIKHIGNVVRLNDDCVVDPAMLPTYVISKVASRKVKMVLSGEGGDENFGGYERYGMLEKPWFAPRCLRFLRYKLMITLIRDKERKKIVAGGGYRPESLVMRPFISGNKLNDILSFEQKTYLPDNLLIKCDRMTMGAGIEGRVPFLDKSIMDYASTLHYSLKIKDGEKKYILKKVALKYLPRDIVYRKKHGFSVPVGRWFTNNLKSEAENIVTEGVAVKELGLRKDLMMKWYPTSGKYKKSADGLRLWRLFVLNKWYGEFFG